MARFEYNTQTGETRSLPDLPANTTGKYVPQYLTMKQARLVLHREKLTDKIAALLTALPEPQKTEALLTWEFASGVDRNDPLVQLLKSQLKLTEEDLDGLFLKGSVL